MEKIKVMKNVKYVLGFLVLVTIIMLSTNKNNVKASYYSDKNKPEFYGLTYAEICSGDEFDIKSSKFRIFARDFEDGDLTDKIEVVWSNVNSKKQGDYGIKYKVSDSDGNVTAITVNIKVTDNLEERYYERTLYSLPSVSNLSSVGVNRGKDHDRQMLGFYMEPSDVINVKVISGANSLSLSYWNNCSEKEFIKNINSEYTEITSGLYNGVPFVKTVYEASEPVVIGIKENGNVNELAYYHYKDNQEEFFEKWNSVPDSYAVVESEDVTLLAPYDDRDRLLSNQASGFSSLDLYLEFWHKVINQYDEYIGISYNPIDPIDQNVKVKYFVKANSKGAGSAYYSGTHIATNNVSVAGMCNYNWGVIHEIGHGYQGSLGSRGMQLGEVSNNILGHYVQIDKTIYQNAGDWLGSIASIEDNIQNKRYSGMDFNSIELRDRLYVLINLLDTFNPKESYAYINHFWRTAVANGETYTNAEAYVIAFYDLYNVNVVDYFEGWGLEISDSVKERVSGAETLDYLAEIIDDKDSAKEISEKLNKQGKYSLVSQKDLESYNLYGNININLQIDDINKLIGKYIIVKNGDNYQKKIKITGKKIELNNVLACGYEVILPVPMVNSYKYTTHNYLTVKNNQTSIVTYNYKNTVINNYLEDEIIQLKGLGDWIFSTISFANNKIVINTNSGQPHSYFSTTYASIIIKNEKGEEVYKKEYIGNVNPGQSIDEIKYSDKYTIEIYHAEGMSRLIVYSNILGKKDEGLAVKDKNQTFKFGERGLYIYNQSEVDNTYDLYKNKIYEYVDILKDTISDDDLHNKTKEVQKKRVFNNLIENLKDEDKKEIIDLYGYLVNGSSPVVTFNSLNIKHNEKFDIYKMFSVNDLEDGIIDTKSANVTLKGVPADSAKVGKNTIKYTVYDSDGNVTYGSVVLNIEYNCMYCNDGEKTIPGHFTKVITKATNVSNGKVVVTCSDCKKIISNTVINKIGMVELSTTRFVYDGKQKTPSIIVKDYLGNIISSDNYTLSYDTGRIKVGDYKVKITFKNNYNYTKTLKFSIVNLNCDINYRTHVQTFGWQKYVKNGEMSGTTGKAKRLEGINIKLTNNTIPGGIEYRTHVQTYGWQNFVKNGEMSGTSGQAKRLEAIQIRLTGEIAKYYDVYYRVHCQKFGWLGWAKNGQSAGSAGYAYRLEGIEIKLVKKGGKAPGATSNCFKEKK